MSASPPATAATSQARAALPRAVLLDLDATLIDSVPDIAEAVRRSLESKVRAGATVGMITPDELLAQTFSAKRPF